MGSAAQNADALRELDRVLAKIKRLNKAPELVAKELAKETEKQLERQIAAGQAPDGSSWKKTKTGKQPLTTAAKALRVFVQGPIVTVELFGHIARHHLGAVRGGIKRQILPSRNLPQSFIEALRRVAKKRLEDL